MAVNFQTDHSSPVGVQLVCRACVLMGLEPHEACSGRHLAHTKHLAPLPISARRAASQPTVDTLPPYT